jgi:hypothetical protein
MIATLPKKEEKTYAMLGGGTIRGASAAALVRALRASSYAPCDSEQAFMNEMSERCRFYSGATIGTYTKAQFIEDLIHNGFLTETDPDDPKLPDNVVDFEPNPNHGIEEPKP